ncbi:GNAT family N-acetyltransferase [Paenibacillus sp. WLX1005]|uniref:GNAT family N-acetyltransferase n=1 Tax=Paenibacillus sp. WLX1005 TaxID=3243766 RepID=UPI0039841439
MTNKKLTEPETEFSTTINTVKSNSNTSAQAQSEHQYPAVTTYEYRKLHAMPETDMLQHIATLHESIFAAREDDGLIQKIHNNVTIPDINKLLTIVALDEDKVIGYKIGYPLMEDQNTFYSWLGGVDPNYRKQGIASMLMDMQHNHLRQSGYRKVQTKTMNRWRNMLLLNIQYGFDIVDTFTDARGSFKIVLEKDLV